MNIMRGFFKHFVHPQGFWGRVVARRLDISNRAVNEWTLALLELQPGDHMLEAGFGSGLTLQRAAALVRLGFAAGVDSSQTMLEIAQQRNATAIAAGQMEFKLGDMAVLTYADNCFDKVYAVQVINYLPDPLQGIQELYRVTKPGGRAALFFEPKEKFEKI